MTRREQFEDVAAFTLAIVLLAVGFATSWQWLIAGLIVAALVIRDLVRKLRASNTSRSASLPPGADWEGPPSRPGIPPDARVGAAPPL